MLYLHLIARKLQICMLHNRYDVMVRSITEDEDAQAYHNCEAIMIAGARSILGAFSLIVYI